MKLLTFTFREEVRPEDLGSIREILDSSGFFSTEEVEVAVSLGEERLEKGLASGYHFLLAESAGKAVAFTCFGRIPCTDGSFDLYWIAVHNNFRGAGIGKELLTRTEQAMENLGGSRIYVETSSREQYRPTRSFYVSAGYQEAARLDDFYGPGDSKIIYVKVMKHEGKRHEPR